MRMAGPGPSVARWTARIVAAALLVTLAVVAYQSRHWRLVNDAAQLDYVCFLIGKGFVPYGQLMEMNMPGIYMINSSVMHVLGGGDIAWRIFDGGLLVTMAVAMMGAAGRKRWLAGLIAALLFALQHWSTGAANLGQRDLIIAVLLVGAYAFLFHGLRRQLVWPMVAAGLCCGAAATVKPTPLPFAVLLLLLMAMRWRSLGYPRWWKPLLAGCAGLAVPVAAFALFLIVHHAVHPFLYVLRVQLPFYTKIYKPGYAGLLSVAFPGAIAFLAAITGVAVLLRRATWRDWEHGMIVLGVVFGAASFIGQHKGFPYHVYPLYAFLFLWAATQLGAALREYSRVLPRAVALVGILGIVLMGFGYAADAHRTFWEVQFDQALTPDLERLGGAQLSGHVQCLATLAECDTALYRMKLVQSTGLIYDFFLFGPANERAVVDARRNFIAQVESAPPRVIVLARGFITGSPEYDRVNAWPRFADFLNDRYAIYDERNFPSDQLHRLIGFRVYVLRGADSQ
jgi:hypothetical protein